MFIAKYPVFKSVKKGIIIGVIIAIAIGIVVVSVYSSDLNEDEMIQNSQSDAENSEEATPQQEEGRQLSIELEEKIGLKSP